MDMNPGHTETITATLSDVTGYGGTFNLSYPAGKSAADFAGSNRSYLTCSSKDVLYEGRSHYTVTYGSSNITVTMQTAQVYTEGEVVHLHVAVGAKGQSGTALPVVELASPAKMDAMTPVKINLGAPIASDSDGAVAEQACTAAGGLATGINGALASGGVATFDVPRNVVAGWTGTAVLTVTGTDEYGNVLVESSASGTSLTGKKAFKTVTGVSTSADITALTVGTSKVLGLPAYLGDIGDVVKEMEDGSAPTAGTVVAGVAGAQTATTGDVRGTYAPNSNPNGSKVFELHVMMRDPAAKGAAQYDG